ADAQTGQAHEIWHSGSEMNDSLPPFAETSLKFAANGRIIFCSEQTGRNHLYVVGSNGGKAAALTQGDFDVEDVERSPDRTILLYSSNDRDIDRRHISGIRITQFDPEPRAGKINSWMSVSSGDSIEWHPVMLADGVNVVCFRSTATVPAMPYVVTNHQ